MMWCIVYERETRTRKPMPKSDALGHWRVTAVLRITSMMDTNNLNRDGALPVETRQAGRVPGPQPRRGPPFATKKGGHLNSSTARKGRSKVQTTGMQERESPKPLHILQWNAEGVFSKKGPLTARLEIDKIDVACIQETHLNPDKRFTIRGFQTFRMDRIGHKGGVMILVKNTIPAKDFQIDTVQPQGGETQAEIHGVNISLNNTDLTILNLYCPDNKKLSLQCMEIPNENCLVVGDFNSHSTCWGYEENDSRGDEVEDWQSETNLILINDPSDPPTFYSRRWLTTSTPDLSFTSGNLSGKTKRQVMNQLGGSDHRPILLAIDLKFKPKDVRTFPRWNYKKANWESFRQLTNEYCKKFKTNHHNINYQAKNFNEIVIKAATKCIPRGARRNYRPYWTEELQKLEDEVEKARTTVETHPSVSNNIALKASTAKCRRTYIQSARASWQRKTEELNMDRDSKKLWNLTRAMLDEERQPPPIVIEKDNKLFSGWHAANCLIDNYKEIGNLSISDGQRQHLHRKSQSYQQKEVPDYMDKPFSPSELDDALRQLKPNKSPGPDKITNEMLQHLGDKAKSTLLKIFNNSWRTGHVPQSWREANMIPILKKGKDRRKTESYRPISLTSCVGKVVERMINSRLTWHLEHNGILTKEQAGFRQNLSTEDQVTFITQSIEDGFQDKQHTLAVWIDFEKAFDRVWKDGLLFKMQECGVAGKMYKWILQYLNNRKARVQVNGSYSRKKTICNGVPQGGVLSPTLFLIFINDIMENIPRKIQGAMYADDLVLWQSEENLQVARYRIQEALQRLEEWTKMWHVKLNPTKTTFTVFSLSTKIPTVSLTINGHALQHENSPTYLGVTFDRRLTWKQEVENNERKGKARLAILRKLSGTTWGADLQTLKRVYTGNVRPVLEYGMASWGTTANSHFDRLGKVQNQAMRVMTGAIKSTPVTTMETVTGLQPLTDRRDSKVLTQAAKYRRLMKHPMRNRIARRPGTRLKRSSFIQKSTLLPEQNGNLRDNTPVDIPVSLAVPPWDWNKEIQLQLQVPGISPKGTQTAEEREALTDSYIEYQYPKEAWTRVYTDGSAENAVRNGGAGIYIQLNQEHEEKLCFPTGHFSSNYKAEASAIERAATILKEDVRTKKNVVILTDALSVLQSLKTNKDKDLNKTATAINHLSKNHIVQLQWIPAHCGIKGNETADILAKQGASSEQLDLSTTYSEEKVKIKTYHKTKWKNQHPNHNPSDPFYKLSKQDQTIIFRLRTNHNRFNEHMFKMFKIGTSDQCSCMAGCQTTTHILQSCSLYKSLRDKIWPTTTLESRKLYGSLEDLQRTAAFVIESGLSI